MGDLTQLEMVDRSIEFLQSVKDDAAELSYIMSARPDNVDITGAFIKIKAIRFAVDGLADFIGMINREQKGSEEAIQKQQIMYAKEQERKRLAEEAAMYKPARFNLD